jgi:hypothetical protein
MKIVLDIPYARTPGLPTFQISSEPSKIRIPFLSLLFKPRSLNKWLFMGIFCAYLTFCWACFFWFEQPRIDHESGYRFGADSPTYWDYVDYRKEHVDTKSNLVRFDANYFGPVAIGTILQSAIAVNFLNILLFFLAVEVACTIPGVDRYKLIFLLMICSETAPALVTLNKEIMVLVSALLMAKYLYSKKRSLLLLGVIFLFSFVTRWEQIVILLVFLFLQRRGSVFQRNPWFAVSTVIAGLTVSYGLVAMVAGPAMVSFTRFADGGGTIVLLNKIQAHFGFPLVMIPKILMDVSGEVLRPYSFLKGMSTRTNFSDIHTWFILPAFSLAMIPVLVIAYRRGRLDPRRPTALLAIIYLLVVAITPFAQPRYNYFVYVLLALELAKKEPALEEATTEERILLPA